MAWSPLIVRVFHLLNVNGLGTDAESAFGVSSRYPLILELEVARRLSALIN
jgi:hypothetical protein